MAARARRPLNTDAGERPVRTRHRWARRGVVLAAGVGLALVMLAGLALVDRWSPAPVLAPLEYSVQVLAEDGQVLRLYTTSDGFWRLPLRLGEVDPRFIERLLATEDRRFHRHPGVDPLALARATLQALRQGRVVSGGSTLTMQLVRLLEPRPRRLSSKLVEMLRAWQLERRLDKTEILELYLTLAPYGGNLQGLSAASRFYFGREPRFLAPEEMALLIALPQAPEARRPDRHPARATAARNRLLQRWAADAELDMSWLQSALSTPVPVGRHPAPRHAAHAADRVRGQADAWGRVVTTLDADRQRQLERLLARKQAELAPGQTSAALVVEHATGRVRAWAGSGDYFGQGFPAQVDMVSAVRSPGSLLKPFIYGLAFEQGIAHPATLVADRAEPHATYAPRNFDLRYQGEMTMADALRRSRNLPAVRVLERTGTDALLELMARAGADAAVPGGRRPGLAIGLGGMGLDMLDLAALYGAIGQQGISRRPFLLPGSAPSPEGVRLFSEPVAWQLAAILAETPHPQLRWSGRRVIALKTGTSFGYRDAWAVGVDGWHTVVVWVGRPDGGYTPGFTGLEMAVPLLLDGFEGLPAPKHAWPGPAPNGTLLARTEGLPAALQRFERRSATSAPVARSGPRFAFPGDGAALAWTADRPDLLVEVRGGDLPLTWLVDGRPAALQPQGRRHLWQPERPGSYRLTVIDARGRAGSVRVMVVDPLALGWQLESNFTIWEPLPLVAGSDSWKALR